MIEHLVVDNVSGRVRSRKCNSDNKVRGGEAQKAKHQCLALPAGQELFEHGQTALTVWRGSGHLVINGQGTNQSQQDKNRCGDR